MSLISRAMGKHRDARQDKNWGKWEKIGSSIIGAAKSVINKAVDYFMRRFVVTLEHRCKC